MAIITPEELINYTVFPEVKKRAPELLTYDIIEAENEINLDFSDPEKFPNGVPDDAKLAYLKMAQFYALINQDPNIIKGVKSESISASNYSYTLASGVTIQKPDVSHLIAKYASTEGDLGNKVSLRMRVI